MEESIAQLIKAIEAKRAPLELAETRLATRKQRPNLELCRDPPQYRYDSPFLLSPALCMHIRNLHHAPFKCSLIAPIIKFSALDFPS